MEDQTKNQDQETEQATSTPAKQASEDGFRLEHEDYLEIFDNSSEGQQANLQQDKRSGAVKETTELRAMQQLELAFEEQLTLEGRIEALLFASPRPLKVADLVELLQDDEDSLHPKDVEAVLAQLMAWYSERSGGFHLEFIKPHGYQFRTVAAASSLMERLFSNRPRPLSRAALETLSIIAYRQPATRADVEFIRGVDAGSIIKNLLDRDLIRCVGRKEDAGRPMLFGTTEEFLKVFSLKSLDDLPPLAAFQAEGDMVQEAIRKIDQGDVEVDVEGFVGDESQEKPEVSEGVESDHAEMAGPFLADELEVGPASDLEPDVDEDSSTRLVGGASGSLVEEMDPAEVAELETGEDGDFEIEFDDERKDDELES